MSTSTVAQVRSSSKSTRSARTLLLIIASHVNPDTGWAWPSLPTLAEETRLTVRRAIQLVQVLEALGELEVRRGRGRGHVNFYRVHLPPPEKVKFRAPKGEISNPEKVKPLSSESPRERKEKREPVARASDKPERRSPFWCDAHGFCHSERLEDHRPDCVLERPGDPRSAWPEGQP
jgi:hypothetical protein